MTIRSLFETELKLVASLPSFPEDGLNGTDGCDGLTRVLLAGVASGSRVEGAGASVELGLLVGRVVDPLSIES